MSGNTDTATYRPEFRSHAGDATVVEDKYNPAGYGLAPNDADVTVEQSVADMGSYGEGGCTDVRPDTNPDGDTCGETERLPILREIYTSNRSTVSEDRATNDNFARTPGLVESVEVIGDSQTTNKTKKTKQTKRKTIHGNTSSVSVCVASKKKNNCDGRYECHVCNKTYTTKHYMKMHMNIHDKVRFPCSACDKTFSTDYTMRAHAKLHVADSSDMDLLQCDICEKVYTNATNLQLHRQEHDGSQAHQCDICDLRFSRKHDLDCHYMIHTGDYNFTCAKCDHGFIRKGDYNRHMLSHTGEGKHRCPYCDKVLVRRAEMQLHLSTHEESGVDGRPKCIDCGSVFSSPYLFQKHMRVCGHGNNMQLPTAHVQHVKHLTCSVCSKVFNSVSNLNRHVRGAHDDDVQEAFSCEQCTKSFRSKRGLREHVAYVHLKVRNFRCSICGKGFAKGKALAKHEKRFHLEEIIQEPACGIKLEPGGHK